MNREQAKALIRNVFENKFNKDTFVVFIKNLLNEIEEKRFIYQGNYIPDAFKPYITSLERIGKYNDGESEIDILIVKLQRKSSLERARTRQRNFIAWYLKGSRGGKLKDAALVAFVSPDEENWRFSLVKMDYRYEESPSGNVRIKEEFTPARRWSFLVGKGERSHTAQSRFVPILEDDAHKPTLAQLEEAFNIEPVTKEFFNKYRDLLIRTVDALDNIVEKDPVIRKDFEMKNINTVDFAKKLLGQIVFLYFLQKKGWFGVPRDGEWGTGPRDFMRRLFRKEYGDYSNFFNDILEPLFYKALAQEREDDFYSRFNCKIPFLNGGLFEPIGRYDWVHTDILLPNDLFSNNRRAQEGDIGDGILDVFDRFNFTVKEDEPLEKEVAIDPELLGKLYEKFNAIRPDNFYEYKKALASGKRSLEKQFNKKFGVYYTPREIVHYMCQQSLIYYLSSELERKVSKEDIEILIKHGEQLIENEIIAEIKEQRIKEGKQKTSDYEHKLPESIRKNAKIIDDKLRDIKICDPAIGSGAFPVGMMHEIVKTRNVLSTFIKEAGRSTYNFKRECIENSLYGVDIDAGACEVAKLRLWLSLIVDEEDIREIKPLPNLDYKIVCGNSLLGVEKDLFNNELFNQLEKLKPLYFNETNPEKKRQYKNQIEELISRITKGRKEFDFEVYFSEVFHEKSGFDVVIANPPYLKERGNKKIFREIIKYDFGKKYHQGKMDYWFYFLHKAIDIVKRKGIISFITSRYWLNSRGATKLIKRIKKELSFIDFVDIGKLKVFDEVVGQHMVAIYSKTKTIDKFVYKKLERTLEDIDKTTTTENVTVKFRSNKLTLLENEIVLEDRILTFSDTVLLGNIT
ncbi:MAG: Eco57I restriction-modification methylase domain-containing protein, partial [Candidatus Aminicenantes bacterium]|nr:Eco57I restriction-modification methylase domain-containing protein [Candidatus Aminicenantes bacterium]